jgi:carbonic anhydrase
MTQPIQSFRTVFRSALGIIGGLVVGAEVLLAAGSSAAPDSALVELQRGNQRFLAGRMINTDYRAAIERTKDDQHPRAAILSCIDSRVPPEIIFDQGIGNIFVARVAGNIEDPDIIGSLEFAAAVKGTPLIVVMGHSGCGAVKGAITNVTLGNLTPVLSHIALALRGDSTNLSMAMEQTAKQNVRQTIEHILKGSDVLSALVREGRLAIAGAYYDLATGKVDFLRSSEQLH